MTQEIYDTKHFPFSSVDLGKPVHRNGMYFIKMVVKDSPIYVQPPKCFIKQGILKSGKKWFCDLVFSIEDGFFLTWLEQIEEIAKQKLFENREHWFETELDEHDIESSLVSPYKMFRSGKFFIIRTNLPTTLDKCDLKIYDETEHEIQPEDVKEETNVITIIELKGIKCSARNFQFVFDVRQMLVIAPIKIFEKCVIKKTPTHHVKDAVDDKSFRGNAVKINTNRSLPTTTTTSNNSVHLSGILPTEDDTDETDPFNTKNADHEVRYEAKGVEDKYAVAGPDTELPVKSPIADNKRSNTTYDVITGDGLPSKVIPRSPLAVADTSSTEFLPYTTPEMYEFEIDLANLEQNDTVQIKPRNDVYYKLYKEAKQKAKEAKLLALSNYLEAKRLKNTYLLEDSSDSSDDDEDDVEDNNGEIDD